MDESDVVGLELEVEDDVLLDELVDELEVESPVSPMV